MNTKNIPVAVLILMAAVNFHTLDLWRRANKRTSELIVMVEKAQAQTTAALDVADKWELAYRLCSGNPATPSEPPSNVSLAAR